MPSFAAMAMTKPRPAASPAFVAPAASRRAATVRAFRNHYRGQGGTVLDAEDLRILHALTSGPDANH